MNAYEIVKELGVKSIVKGRQNYIVYVSTLFNGCAIAATKKVANARGYNSCYLCDLVAGDVVILKFTYIKDVEKALDKLKEKINTKWA
jgi:hypothetical protein